MKAKSFYYLILLLAVLVVGCGKDNYDAPTSQLTGKVTYNGAALNVRGTNNSVQLEIWQRGYRLFTSIPVYVGQDGSFTALLFDGKYKLVSRNGNGPWVSKQDTIAVVVKGSTTVDYPVTPYYTISNESIKLNGSTLTATFTINTVNGTQPVERAILVVNKTQFVDESANIARTDKMSPGTGVVTMTMDLSASVLSNVLLNARVGVKIAGREAIYTPLTKIK